MAHIINGYDIDSYEDGDICTEVFAVHDGEFPAEQPRHDSSAYAKAFLMTLLQRPCTPLEGTPDESITFMDDETGLGFTVAYETGEESAYGTVEVSDVRVARSSAYDREDTGDSTCRDNDAPSSLADRREKVLAALAAVDVTEMDGDSHVWLSAICGAVHQSIFGWTRGACAALTNDLITLIGTGTGDYASNEVIAQLRRRLDRKQRRLDALREENRVLVHRLAIETNLAAHDRRHEGDDLERENERLRRKIDAYRDSVAALVDCVNALSAATRVE